MGDEEQSDSNTGTENSTETTAQPHSTEQTFFQSEEREEEDGRQISARALFPFVTDEPDRLGFEQNDLLTMLLDSEQNGWIRGWRMNHPNIVGYFPRSYVQQLSRAEADAALLQTTSNFDDQRASVVESETPKEPPAHSDTSVAEPTTVPVETSPVETSPVETSPVETSPVETPPVETPPVTPEVSVPETPPVQQVQISDEQKKREKMERIRNQVIEEIVRTERVYLKALNFLVEQFVTPLEDDDKFAGIMGGYVEAQTLLKVTRVILRVNAELLYRLEGHLDYVRGNFSQGGSNSKRSDVVSLGKIFLTLAPFFKTYSQYCNNYESVIEILDVLKDKNITFQSFIDHVDECARADGQTLLSYLITPVQRIPRYNLLLKELLKNTPDSNPDHSNLCEALSKTTTVAELMNRSFLETANRKLVPAISQQFSASSHKRIVQRLGQTLVQPSRKFLHRGLLVKVSSRSIRAREFFSFNDLVLYARSSNLNNEYILSGLILLSSIPLTWVLDLPVTDERQNVFLIVGSKKTHIVFAETPAVKKEWMQLIVDQVAALVNKLHYLQGQKWAKVRLSPKNSRLIESFGLRQPLEQIIHDLSPVQPEVPIPPPAPTPPIRRQQKKPLSVVEELRAATAKRMEHPTHRLASSEPSSPLQSQAEREYQQFNKQLLAQHKSITMKKTKDSSSVGDIPSLNTQTTTPPQSVQDVEQRPVVTLDPVTSESSLEASPESQTSPPTPLIASQAEEATPVASPPEAEHDITSNHTEDSAHVEDSSAITSFSSFDHDEEPDEEEPDEDAAAVAALATSTTSEEKSNSAPASPPATPSKIVAPQTPLPIQKTAVPIMVSARGMVFDYFAQDETAALSLESAKKRNRRSLFFRVFRSDDSSSMAYPTAIVNSSPASSEKLSKTKSVSASKLKADSSGRPSKDQPKSGSSKGLGHMLESRVDTDRPFDHIRQSVLFKNYPDDLKLLEGTDENQEDEMDDELFTSDPLSRTRFNNGKLPEWMLEHMVSWGFVQTATNNCDSDKDSDDDDDYEASYTHNKLYGLNLDINESAIPVEPIAADNYNNVRSLNSIGGDVDLVTEFINPLFNVHLDDNSDGEGDLNNGNRRRNKHHSIFKRRKTKDSNSKHDL